MRPLKTGLIIIDLIILAGSYVFMAGIKPVMSSYLQSHYLWGFGITFVIWLIASFYFNKFQISRKEPPSFIFRKILYPNLISLAFVAFIIYAFNTTFYSRMMVFGTFGVATFLEMTLFSLYTYLLMSPEYETAKAFLEEPPTADDIKQLKKTVTISQVHVNKEALREAINEECGEKASNYIESQVDIADDRTLVTSTLTRFNILRQPDGQFNTIVNIRRVNDLRYINKFFEAVNHKLPKGGLFIGCAETSDMRRIRILAKYPPVFNWIIYTMDYIIKRVFPKFYPTRGIYFFLTRGNNRVLSHPEILGRLYSCGFEFLQESYVNGLYFFVVRKIKQPSFDPNPTYGPFITLRRVGKEGKLIKVYKLRTMYPYAEYLQDYVHKKNQLENGGKFKNDFRVAESRAILRKLWIDELPMLINLIRGDLKIVGVRPLSKHYFDLYSKELQEKRIKYKPGLIPPFYADMPETLEEIQDSERKYLDSFEKRPFRTQWRYFWKAIRNIIFKRARSA